MLKRLLTVAIVAATLVLVGCDSFTQDSIKKPKASAGQVSQATKPSDAEVEKLLKEQVDLLRQQKIERSKQCSREINDCDLHALLNKADDVYKRDAKDTPPPREVQLEILQEQGFLVQVACGWKIHDNLFDFLVAVRDQDTLQPKLEKRPAKASKDKE